jgi:hypothetical protein
LNAPAPRDARRDEPAESPAGEDEPEPRRRGLGAILDDLFG